MSVDVSDILHVLAHELRTPIGIAHGYVRLLLEDRLPQEADRRRALEQMHKALGRLSELSQESSALAAWFEQAGTHHACVPPRAILERVAAADYEWPVKIDTTQVNGNGVLRTRDIDGLARAIINVVRATARELRGSECVVVARDDQDMRLEILAGPPERLMALQAGPTAADASPIALERGGLGLALVHAAVVLDAHGADRWTLQGSRQTAGLRLPLEKVKPVTPAKLALVDDDQQFVEYLETLLKSRGYDVHPFSGGSDLLQTMHSDTPPDVVLLDVSMPGMDGLETLKAIRVAHPHVQVIMLSGRDAPATIVDAMRQGAFDYVVKPDDPDGLGEAALEAAIRNAIERTVLSSEVARLRTQVGEDPEGVADWGPSAAMRHVMTMVDRIADSDVGVLLRGESGVGKEVIARELHRRSSRRSKPFVKVNAAALPSELLESELFGHERGAFTGAQTARVGKFEFANHGTLMLDEIGEMPAGLQAKLLHVLQDNEFTKLGSNRPVSIDVRIIAATNRDLEAMMRAGSFREDLYYRLQVIELHVPPLRERREEIPQLIEFFLVRYSERYGKPLRRPSDALRDTLLNYSWPGNVRELENVLKRFVILQDEGLVLAELKRARANAESTFPSRVAAPPSTPQPAPAADVAPPAAHPASASSTAPTAAVADAVETETEESGPEPAALTGPVSLPELAREAAMRAERAAIQQALDRFRWNRRKAADFLGVSYKTLLNKMKECGISEQQ